MDRGNARFTTTPFYSKGEIRGINSNDYIRWCGKEIAQQPGPDAEKFPDATKNFHQPHNRQPFHGHQRVETFGNHLIATNADKSRVRVSIAERTNQTSAENIPRGLTCNQAKGYSAIADSRSNQGMIHQTELLPAQRIILSAIAE